jgi:hypothetical protein
MRKLFRGMLISFGVVQAMYPTIVNEIEEQECDCHGMGYTSDFHGEVWFICGYHTGVMDSLREMKV